MAQEPPLPATGEPSRERLLQATIPEAAAALGSRLDLGLTEVEARARRARIGPNEIPEETPRWFRVLAKKFWGLSAWMIELIIVLSWLLKRWSELGIAAALLGVNALISFLQDRRANLAVAALRSRLSVNARVLRDGAWKTEAARELVPGDVIRLRSGDFVPADAKVIQAELGVDQSSMTGESLEVAKGPGSLVYSGSVVRRGEATALVLLTGSQTYYGRTTELVQSARPKLRVEAVVAGVVRWLFALVGVLVAAAVIVAVSRGYPIVEILPLALVLLLGAVPVALPVMFTVSMAVGSLELARRGVLVTRLGASEDAAGMDILLIDKTGTLTQNRLSVTGLFPASGHTDREILRYGAWASEEANQDPIDLALLEAARSKDGDPGSVRVLRFVPFSPETRRTEAVVEVEGRRLRLLKGALHAVAEACGLEPSALEGLETLANREAQKGSRVLAVAAGPEQERPSVVGLLALSDPPRPDAPALVEQLTRLGVQVKMLTGDALPIGEEVARRVGLGPVKRAQEFRDLVRAGGPEAAAAVEASGGFAEVYPEDKFTAVQALQGARHVTGMTGDGVNDAPALKQAEVGIAVKNATDVAKGAASVVLTSEGLTSIVDLVRNGRIVHQRILTWIVNKISRTIVKTGLVTGAFLLTGKFIISAAGMMGLVFMTDFVKVTLATDRAEESPWPATWAIGGWVKVGAVLGLLLGLETGALLFFGWRVFGLGRDPEVLSTFTFLTFLLFALFSLLSLRERRAFWKSRPSPLLGTALALDGLVGLGISILGAPGFCPIPFVAALTILGYSVVVNLWVNDWAKRALIEAWISRKHGA